MMTAGEVAEASLKRILVQASDAPLEADQFADFIEAMNNFMAALSAKGTRLGYSPVSNVSDIVNVPDGALRGLIANMAVEVAPDYNATVSPQLQQHALDGMRIMRRIGRPKLQTRLPGTLPKGSRAHSHTFGSDFYRPKVKALLSLAGNTKPTILDAANVETPITGEWSTEQAENLLCDVSGRIENAANGAVRVTTTAIVTLTGTGNYVLAIKKNGTDPLISKALVLAGAPQNELLKAVTTLNAGDYLQITIADTATDSEITINSAVFEVF